MAPPTTLIGGGQRTPFPANGKPWPLEGLEAAQAMRSARKAAARPPRSLRHGDQWSPCRN
eukprot:1246351-Prymnesium_polylepis.1